MRCDASVSLPSNLKGKPKSDRKTTTTTMWGRGEEEGVARYAVYKLRVRHAANEFHAVTLEVWPGVCVCLEGTLGERPHLLRPGGMIETGLRLVKFSLLFQSFLSSLSRLFCN